jgi:hypothetical protein
MRATDFKRRVDAVGELWQRDRRKRIPIPRQKMIVEDIGDHATKTPKGGAKIKQAAPDDWMRICESINETVVLNPTAILLREMCQSAGRKQIGQDTPHLKCRVRFCQQEMREPVHSRNTEPFRKTDQVSTWRQGSLHVLTLRKAGKQEMDLQFEELRASPQLRHCGDKKVFFSYF